ncbi:FlgO family outer membrane protein [Desulfolithobacter sp.]
MAAMIRLRCPTVLRCILPGLLLLISAVGCSSLNCTPFEQVLGSDIDLVGLGREISSALALEASPPLHPRQPILVTTIVDNNDLDKTSPFGRSLQNQLASGLVRQGYQVSELKLRRNLMIRSGGGEFMLSRDLEQVSRKQRVQAVVVGTYTLSQRVLYLSIHLVRPSDQTILATWDRRLCLDENTLRMLGFEYEDMGEITPPSRSLLDRILYY